MAWQLYQGDALETLKQMEDESINCCVTSPPYWGLRDYGIEGQIGLENTPEEYVANMVEVFREVKRVLRKDGTLWLNLGDTYNGTKIGNTETKKNPRVVSDSFIKKSAPNVKVKDLIGIPWMVAFALRADGWWLRSDIIWAKGNPMPESVQDRPTKSHEYIFLLSKSKKYFYDADAIAEPVTNSTINRLSQNIEEQAGSDRISPKRNKRTVWNINTKPYKEAHFATFPPKLPEICIKAGCPDGGTVLDPFAGAGTTLWVAEQLGVNSIGIELNPDYCDIIRRRMAGLEMNLFLAK